MAFIPPIAKDKLATTSDDDLRQIDGKALAGPERDEEWDKAFETRVSTIPAVASIVNDLKNPGIATDRSKDSDILNRFNALISDVERIGAFNAGTRVEQSQIEPNKPRLKAIFLFLGPEFQKSHKRAKDGQAIKPFKSSALLRADRPVTFVKTIKR